MLDLKNCRFGRLIVIKFVCHNKHRHRMWECLCDCDQTTIVSTSNLRNGKTQSCGCLAAELTSLRSLQHGMTGTPEYNSWRAMKWRTQSSNASDYEYYGGRGIEMCNEWQSFSTFLADMGKLPTSDHTLERIDNDKPYSPSNCRWATRSEQARNRRSNHLITYQDKTQCLVEWAEQFDIKYGTLETRLRRGWSVEKALTTPVKSLD